MTTSHVAPPSKGKNQRFPWKMLVRSITWIAGLLVLDALVTYFFHVPLLRTAARIWIVDEEAGLGDAVVVLGGGANTRPFAAAELVRTNATTNVLLARVQPTPTDILGVTLVESDLSRAVLIKQGVPESCIHGIGTNASSTYDEARAVRTWAIEHRPKVIIIPTDLFHTRRVNWLMEKQLKDLHVDVRIVALDTPEYNRTNWWQHEQGVVAFQNEIIKYLLYRWRY